MPTHTHFFTLLTFYGTSTNKATKDTPMQRLIGEDRQYEFQAGSLHSRPKQRTSWLLPTLWIHTAPPRWPFPLLKFKTKHRRRKKKPFKWCEQNPGLTRLLLNILPAMILSGLIALTVFLSPEQPDFSTVPNEAAWAVSFCAYVIWYFICIIFNAPCSGGCPAALVCIFYSVLFFAGALCIGLKPMLS